MAATITSITKTGYSSWLFTWTGTEPFYVWRDGVLVLDGVSDTETIIEGTDAEEPPAIQVLDSTETDDPLTVAYPPFGLLQWRGDAAVSYYRVDRYVGAAWVTYITVGESGDGGYYSAKTPALVDAVAAQWRIIAVDSVGNESEPLPFTFSITKHPDPPVIDMSYSDGTGLLTIEAR